MNDDHKNAAKSFVRCSRHRPVASWGSCYCGKFAMHLTPPIGWVTSYLHIAQSTQPHRFPRCAPAGSFDVAPTDLDLSHQLVETCAAVELTLFGEVGVTEGGENGLMAENLLHFEQIDARFNQMGGITVAQAVRCNSFFKPQSWVTWRKVV